MRWELKQRMKEEKNDGKEETENDGDDDYDNEEEDDMASDALESLESSITGSSEPHTMSPTVGQINNYESAQRQPCDEEAELSVGQRFFKDTLVKKTEKIVKTCYKPMCENPVHVDPCAENKGRKFKSCYSCLQKRRMLMGYQGWETWSTSQWVGGENTSDDEQEKKGRKTWATSEWGEGENIWDGREKIVNDESAENSIGD